MKTKRVVINISAVHLFLCLAFLLVSVVLSLTYSAPGMEPLEFALSKGIYTVFVFVAVIAVVNATMLFLSLRAVFLRDEEEHKRKRKIALCCSGIATVLFYLSAVLIFVINSDAIIIVPLAWLLCEVCSGVLLICSAKSYRG